jgi:hypothetical protein
VGGVSFVGAALLDALLEPEKAARPIARAEPTQRIAERRIRRRSYPLAFPVHHILIES